MTHNNDMVVIDSSTKTNKFIGSEYYISEEFLSVVVMLHSIEINTFLYYVGFFTNDNSHCYVRLG